MKKISLSIIVIFLLLLSQSNFSYGQIKVLSGGNIGLGTSTPTSTLSNKYMEVERNLIKFWDDNNSYTPSPIYMRFYLNDPQFFPGSNHNGYLGMYNKFWDWAYVDDIRYFVSCIHYSDIKFKKNIKDLDNSLEKVLQLRGVKYDLIMPADSKNNGLSRDTARLNNHLGLIAQEIQKVIPEVVKEDSLGLSVDYISLIPVLIEAIKEQDTEIKKLKVKVKESDKKMAEFEAELRTGNPKSSNSSFDESFQNNSSLASLSQNRPNPFNENTTIEYYLPSSIQTATFYIYDLQGKQMKSLPISEREYGSVMIHGSELQPGIYNYSIVADGEFIGLEKMVLTE